MASCGLMCPVWMSSSSASASAIPSLRRSPFQRLAFYLGAGQGERRRGGKHRPVLLTTSAYRVRSTAVVGSPWPGVSPHSRCLTGKRARRRTNAIPVTVEQHTKGRPQPRATWVSHREILERTLGAWRWDKSKSFASFFLKTILLWITL
jgi:hypothetical protein